jgi:antitoxin component YwqK of YwqJK toxin-antitoxin module
MPKLCIMLLASLFAFKASAQDTTYTYYDSKWEECEKGEHKYYGKTFQIGDSLWGQWDYYKGGAIQMRGSYLEKEKETRSGTFIYFQENGDTNALYDYVDGEREGRFITFHDNGNRKVQTHLTGGKQSGFTSYFHENGEISSKGEFSEGQRVGKWDYYDEDGEFIASEQYVDSFSGPCGYKINLPSDWIHWSYDTYGEVHDGVSYDQLLRKSIYDEDGNKQLFQLDAICLKRASLSEEDVCKNMAKKIDHSRLKKISDYNGMTFKHGDFYTYKKKSESGKKLTVLLFANKQGKQIAQLKFLFQPDVDPEIIAEVFDIVNSLEWED